MEVATNLLSAVRAANVMSERAVDEIELAGGEALDGAGSGELSTGGQLRAEDGVRASAGDLGQSAEDARR